MRNNFRDQLQRELAMSLKYLTVNLVAINSVWFIVSKSEC
jgi:hypothetical protein